MECLSAKLKENSNGFAEVWQPLIANLPRNLRHVILKGNDHWAEVRECFFTHY